MPTTPPLLTAPQVAARLGSSMIRAELCDDQCVGCGSSLERAEHVERERVTFARGEYAGERGDVVPAECDCGHTTVIALSVDLRPAA